MLRQSDAEEYLKHVQRLEGEILREPAVPCLSDPEDLGATQVCARSDQIDRDLAIARVAQGSSSPLSTTSRRGTTLTAVSDLGATPV